MEISTEYFSQHMLCSREDKQDCLPTIRILVEIAWSAREGGIRKVEELAESIPEIINDAFFKTAVQLYLDAQNSGQIRRALSVCLITSGCSGAAFLKGTIITEALACLLDGESLDYIFYFLLPAYFGMDYAQDARNVYISYRTQKKSTKK